MKGRIIVLEGLDGAGKTTLASLLSKKLGAVSLATPDAALNGSRKAIDDLYRTSPDAAQLFYASAVAHASAMAARAAAQGQDVIIDRYWLSTWAYAPVRGTRLMLGEVQNRLRAADWTFLLCLTIDERRERLATRGMNEGDRVSLEPAIAAKIERRYRRGLALPIAGRSRVMDVAGKSPEQCAEEMLGAMCRIKPWGHESTGARDGP